MSRGLFASTEYGQRQVGLWEERWKYKEQALGDLYDSISEAAEAIIGPYSQSNQGREPEGWKSRLFYDYYKVGGAWSGRKTELGCTDFVSRSTIHLKDIPEDLTASHVIVAVVDYEGTGFRAYMQYMKSVWNGLNWQKTAFSGYVSDALKEYREAIAEYLPVYREKMNPQDDWLVVTVDYHD